MGNCYVNIDRCLEEGADEFFLKPVRLSDVNKLVPHMMKTITRPNDFIQNQEQEHEEQNQEAESQTTEVVQSQEVQVQPPPNNNSSINNNIKNYKVIEEGLGVGEDRARHAYSGLAVA